MLNALLRLISSRPYDYGMWRDDRRVIVPAHLVEINELLAGDYVKIPKR